MASDDNDQALARPRDREQEPLWTPPEVDSSAPPIVHEHWTLISGFGTFYDTLIALKHIEPEDVQRPPHTELPLHQIRCLGFKRPVLSLLPYLPFHKPSKSESRPVQWGLDTYGLNYSDPNAVLPPAGIAHPIFDPWNLRLTDSGPKGSHYIYDTRIREIYVIPSMNFNSHFTHPTSRPVADVLNELIGGLRDLESMS